MEEPAKPQRVEHLSSIGIRFRQARCPAKQYTTVLFTNLLLGFSRGEMLADESALTWISGLRDRLRWQCPDATDPRCRR